MAIGSSSVKSGIWIVGSKEPQKRIPKSGIIESGVKMRPVSPILEKFKGQEVVYAKDQPQYIPLPALCLDDESRAVLSRWRLSIRERLRVLWHGGIYLHVLTFGHPLQPIKLATEPPILEQESTVNDISAFDSQLGWVPAIPEPFWYRGWRTLWRWRPQCVGCDVIFPDRDSWRRHYALYHIGFN